MTPNDVPAPGPGPQPGRRRVLGRGPDTATPAPRSVDEAAEADTDEVVLAGRADPSVRFGQVVGTGPKERGGRLVLADRGPGDRGVPASRNGVGKAAGPGEAVSAEGEAAGPGRAAGPPAAARTSAPAPVGQNGVPGPGTGADAKDDGSRFKVRLSNFEGPFDLLLQLISKHRLDVTEVALSSVTDEFMAYIRALGPGGDLDETTEFLVVAATLLDLKAARLLPAAEVEDEADLALLEARDLLFARLLQYRAYKRIAEIFSQRLDGETRHRPRVAGLEPQHVELLPEVVLGVGAEGFAKLAVKAMQPRPKPQVYVDHIHAPLVSVREQAAILVARLKELGEAGFRTLTEDTDDTLTVVARFLALLELYREKAVVLDQETALGELTVRWAGGDGRPQTGPGTT